MSWVASFIAMIRKAEDKEKKRILVLTKRRDEKYPP
jgi:hypothetical protein